MKNQLLAGTALVTAAVFAAGGATAQDKMKTMKPSISVNGYFESVVGGTLNEDIKHIVTGVDGNNKLKKSTNRAKDASALDVKTDAEIHFNGSATLDSGLKIHARVELEGMEEHADGDTIDEYFIAVSGSFGQIVLGGTEAAPTKMLGGFSGSFATGVGESLAFDLADWVPSAGEHFSTLQHARLTTNNGGSDDSEKLTYISPNFGGFQIGMRPTCRALQTTTTTPGSTPKRIAMTAWPGRSAIPASSAKSGSASAPATWPCMAPGKNGFIRIRCSWCRRWRPCDDEGNPG